MNIEERMFDVGFEDVIYFSDFGEECLIGIDTYGRAVYSFDKMLCYLVENGMSDIDAIEYIEDNAILNIDNQTESRAPIIMYSCDWLGV